MKIEPFVPIYHRAPNKFVEYREEPFTTDNGGHGTQRIAVYKDRSGSIREEVAQVIWKYNPISGEQK